MGTSSVGAKRTWAKAAMSEKCHVWTAPSWQGLSSLLQHWSVRPCVRPVPFTATSMIGFIALAGIIVRNSILLVDFIRHSGGQGKPLRAVVLEAGAVRFKPILLTALAA